MKISDIKILGACTFTEFYSNGINENGFVLLFMKRNIKIRIFIDFGHNDMTLQQIDDYGDIIDYYDIDQKINFLKLFHDIAKMTKIQ